MTKTKKIIFLTAAFLIASVFTVIFYNYSLDISFSIKSDSAGLKEDTVSLNKPVVYIGVISRYPPNIIFRGYQPMMDYLTSKTNYRFELKLSNDYSETVKMLVNNEVAAAFLGSYVYAKANQEFGVLPILKPLNENFEPFSRSVLFTKSSSGIYNINDLKGKNIALPSKESYSSNWLLNYELKRNGLTEKIFSSITHFPHHQSVIQNVLNGNFDAGVTREHLIKKYTNGSVRVILYSEPFPTSPLVASLNADKNIINEMKNALLEINQSNREREKITKGWDSEFIYGFVEAADKDYEFVKVIASKMKR